MTHSRINVMLECEEYERNAWKERERKRERERGVMQIQLIE